MSRSVDPSSSSCTAAAGLAGDAECRWGTVAVNRVDRALDRVDGDGRRRSQSGDRIDRRRRCLDGLPLAVLGEDP